MKKFSYPSFIIFINSLLLIRIYAISVYIKQKVKYSQSYYVI